MLVFWLGTLLAVLCLVTGFGLGWLVHSGEQKRDSAEGGSAQSKKSESPNALDGERAKEFLSRLHTVAAQVADNVGRHHALVEEISTDLSTSASAGDGSLEEAVVRAVSNIMDANSQLQQQLAEATETIQEQTRQIESHMADVLADPLTGIANRRAFDEHLGRRLAEWKRHRRPFCLAMLDVDHFKRFNDEHGHLAGDQVLCAVAKTMSQTVREMDLAARYGGEEFAVLMPDTSLQDGCGAAERVREAIQNAATQFEGVELRVTASIGLAEVLSGNDAAALIQRADSALYASKKAGRNRTFVHTGEHCTPVENRAKDSATKPISGASAGKKPLSAKEAAVFSENVAEETSAGPQPPDPRTDLLTGLPNRFAFCEGLRHQVAQWRRHQTPLAILLVEVDHFEHVTRQRGKAAAESLLRAVPKCLASALRDTDLLARSGDAQFGVLLPMTDVVGALAAAERARSAISSSDSMSPGGSEPCYTLSIGIAQALESDADSAAILQRAEDALRAARRDGGNATVLHDGRECQQAQAACGAASA